MKQKSYGTLTNDSNLKLVVQTREEVKNVLEDYSTLTLHLPCTASRTDEVSQPDVGGKRRIVQKENRLVARKVFIRSTKSKRIQVTLAKLAKSWS